MPSAAELERLAETHDVAVLTDEEERMLFAFREFKAGKIKAGAIFTWQTHPEVQGGECRSRIIKPDDARLVRSYR